MIALLHAELVKLRTTRTFFALAGVAIFTSVLIAVLVALLSESSREDVLIDVYASDTSSLFILILAVVGISGEWRHRTIAGSLLAAPNRLRFLAAKTLAFAVAGVVLSLLIALTVSLSATAILSIRDLPLPGFGELMRQIGLNAIVAALLGAFGVAVGALMRQQVVAIVAVLLIAFAIEPVVFAVLPEVGRWGPLSALPTAAADLGDGLLGDEVDLPAPGIAMLAMLAWITALFAVGGTLLRRRDL